MIAYNFYGASTESDVGSGAIIVLVPQPPIGLANAPSITTAFVIGLTWNDDMRTGGAPIIDYRVSYDQSTGIYIVLAQGLTTRSYTTTVTLTPGATYNFKVEARNSVGYSNLSTARSIIASQIPDTPNAPVTERFESSIIVDWTDPEFNGGADITSYVIRFKRADGGFSTLLASCDGSDSVIRSATKCTVPSVSFTQAPFSLPWGSLIYATVTAVNNIGSSLTSLEGSGAKILAIPKAPLNLQNRPAITSATQIGLIWDSIPEID